MADPNPFTLVYDALWELAFQHPVVADLVKVGNRAAYNDDTKTDDPVKRTVLNADFPEIVLQVAGITGGNMHQTSSTSMVRRRYTFTISTGDFRLHPKLHQIEWGLFCAMADWKRVMGELVWNGQNFVKRCDLGDVSEGFVNPEKNRGIRGWSAVWACDLEMHFKTSDLKSEMEP
jgi:hypothetical protein